MLWALIKELAKKTQLSDIHIHADRPIAYREHGYEYQIALFFLLTLELKPIAYKYNSLREAILIR